MTARELRADLSEQGEAGAEPELPVMSEEGFVDLFAHMRNPVFTFAVRRLSPEQAADVVGDTFEVAWRKRESAPADPAQWPAWVVGIARNKVLQELQRVARKHHDNRYLADVGEETSGATADIVADVVVESLLSRSVYAQLTSIEKELLDVALIRDIPVRDGAALLGISVTAYTSRVHRLRRRIDDIHRALASAGEGNPR